jgi:hypothetical protein
MVKTPRTSEEARAAVAAELRAVTEEARESSPPREATLPPTRPVSAPSPVPSPAAPTRPEAPASSRRPDNGPVNELWNAPAGAAPGGMRGLAFRLLRAVFAPIVEAQVAFNSRQVQLDNQLLEYIEARLDETHRHYDRILGQYGQHIADANERHILLQGELVTHVHDLVRRIDLVLGETERGRLSLDASLRDLRARLLALEERVRR